MCLGLESGVCWGNKAALGRFLLSHCCPTYFLVRFLCKKLICPTADRLSWLLRARPSRVPWGQGPALGGPRSEAAMPASGLSLRPASTPWPPQRAGSRVLRQLPPPQLCRASQRVPASALQTDQAEQGAVWGGSGGPGKVELGPSWGHGEGRRAGKHPEARATAGCALSLITSNSL